MSKDRRPYICKKLKQMNESGEPVWITLSQGDRVQCVPFDVDDNEQWPMWDQGWFLAKNKGQYHMYWIHERQGRAHCSTYPGGSAFYMSLDNILAKIEMPFGSKFGHESKQNGMDLWIERRDEYLAKNQALKDQK